VLSDAVLALAQGRFSAMCGTGHKRRCASTHASRAHLLWSAKSWTASTTPAALRVRRGRRRGGDGTAPPRDIPTSSSTRCATAPCCRSSISTATRSPIRRSSREISHAELASLFGAMGTFSISSKGTTRWKCTDRAEITDWVWPFWCQQLVVPHRRGLQDFDLHQI